MRQISKDQLESVLDYPSLIDALRQGFCADIAAPSRHHHDYPNPDESSASTLLLMPAWQSGAFLGVKIITVSPHNGKYQLPTVQGSYLLFDAHLGHPLAIMDAPSLTTRRTAASSALASSFLSKPDSKSLLMIGTGAMAPCLIEAHAAVRPLQRVFLWGRRPEQARILCNKLSIQLPHLHVEPVLSIEEVIREADIISAATLSEKPLISGDWLRPGQHLDLVGSFRPGMREADDEAIRRCSLFADSRHDAARESGDLAVPLQRRIITLGSIRADLFDLCRMQHLGRRHGEEITLFKSVGLALEDLVAARLAYSRLPRG